MKIDIQNLLKLAGDAHQGPYMLEHDDDDHHAVHSEKGYEWVCNTDHFGTARFLKECSPEAIKALCEVVRKSQRCLRQYNKLGGLTEHAQQEMRKALEPFTEE